MIQHIFFDDISHARHFLITGEIARHEYAEQGPCSHRTYILMKQIDACSTSIQEAMVGFIKKRWKGVVESDLAATFD